MKAVLVTGFEPFDGETINPSAQVALALNGRVIQGRSLVGMTLPCSFGAARSTLRARVRRLKPELVVCLGQAAGRAALSLERVAINLDDAGIADNAGRQPVDRPVVRGGPVGYWSTLPIKSILRAVRAAGLPAEISQSAGSFVCNHVFYGLMHLLAEQEGVRGGFIHIPYLPEQAARLTSAAPSLSLADATRGIEIAIATSLVTKRDRRARV